MGLAGVVRWLVAFFGAVVVGAALADKHYAMALAGIAVIGAAMALGYRAWRANSGS
jgi:hypothetical protein